MTETNIARASAWMALGTVVSRITGMLRLLLLAIVIGTALNGDIFDLANSIPNSLYILVAGGVFNVVLVPQLVRAMRGDADGGEAYANRIVTLGLLVLGVATVLLMVAVPLIMRIVFEESLFTPSMRDQHDSAQLLMLLCMPQVFFYGAFVLVGQILNSRQRFGPMMWAPIVNNMVAIAVLGIYAWRFGVAQLPANGGFSTTEAWLLGAGSTLGIAVQSVVLLPYLRQVGFGYRPRFDFRGVGLGHTLRLGAWTLGFIVVNQIAYFTIARLAAGASLEGRARGVESAGQAVYSIGFAISQVPHGVITVSLATAIIPMLASLAADHRFDRIGLELSRTMRMALLLIAPIAVAVASLGQQLAEALVGWGASKGNLHAIGTTISVFALAMVMFTLHYLVLRAFYAMEDTRTPFWIQCGIAAANIGFAFGLTSLVEPIGVSTMLALAYGMAYMVGLAVSLTILSRRVGRILDHEMVRFLVRLAITCALGAAVMVGGRHLWHTTGLGSGTPWWAMLELVVVGAAGALTILGVALALRIDELRYGVNVVLRRR